VFSSHAFLTGAKIMRHDIGIALSGEGAHCTMNGVYLADGDRLLDTHSSLDHAMPHCTSHELYKGILAGKARAVFNGRIIVRIDAQKTEAGRLATLLAHMSRELVQLTSVSATCAWLERHLVALYEAQRARVWTY